MAFNEQNTVEHFIIHQITVVNVNAVQGTVFKEDSVEYDSISGNIFKSKDEGNSLDV
jgi:hypothetical protein